MCKNYVAHPCNGCRVAAPGHFCCSQFCNNGSHPGDEEHENFGDHAGIRRRLGLLPGTLSSDLPPDVKLAQTPSARPANDGKLNSIVFGAHPAMPRIAAPAWR